MAVRLPALLLSFYPLPISFFFFSFPFSMCFFYCFFVFRFLFFVIISRFIDCRKALPLLRIMKRKSITCMDVRKFVTVRHLVPRTRIKMPLKINGAHISWNVHEDTRHGRREQDRESRLSLDWLHIFFIFFVCRLICLFFYCIWSYMRYFFLSRSRFFPHSFQLFSTFVSYLSFSLHSELCIFLIMCL